VRSRLTDITETLGLIASWRMDAMDSERVGLLIVRAWLEGPDQRLIARVMETPNVAEQLPTVSVVGTAEDIHAVLQDWLERLRSPRGG
jgi:hypothetical protein